MEALTIQQKQTSTVPVTLGLPYYAMKEDWLCTQYWAIASEKENVTLYHYHNNTLPLIGSANARDLPSDHQQISEGEFREVFDHAIGQLQTKVCAACPSFL
jgi:hypothetical protein